MALRREKHHRVTDWYGLQTTATPFNLGKGWWYSSENVVVTQDGSAAVLRSPLAWNTALGSPSGQGITTAYNFNKQSGDLVIFAENGNVYATTGGANTDIGDVGSSSSLKTKFLTINNRVYWLGDGTAFYSSDGTASGTELVGVNPLAAGGGAAPTLSYVAGGTGSFAVGVSISVAYRNSATGHISIPTLSASLGVSTNSTVRIGTTTNGSPEVDGIVVFMSTDGGSIRYLVTDSAGDPQVFANTTGNKDIIIDNIYWNTQITETISNVAPLYSFLSETAGSGFSYPYFMFKWKNRLLLCDFREADTRAKVQYTAFETVAYGIPWESFPPQNAIYLPNKGDSARGGIETPVGALIFGEDDSYLIEGTLTDKVATGANNISLSESIRPMGWSIGTRSPFSAVTTPFGIIWLDQNKRIQMWTYDGFPVEPGLPIRTALSASIADTDNARFVIEGVWYQHGKDGGIYMLNAANSVQYAITVYRNPEDNQLRFACSKFTLPSAFSFVVANVSGRSRLFYGSIDRLREVMDLDTAGSGWTVDESRFFKTIVGTEDEFAFFHSIKFDCTSITGLTLTVSNYDGSDSVTITPVLDADSDAYLAYLGVYGFRKIISFSFSTDDTTKRVVNNMTVRYAPKRRLL